MPTQGSWRPLVTMSVSLPFRSMVLRGAEDRRGRLDREARDDRLAGGNAAEDAAGMVGEEPRLAVVAHAHLVGVLFAAERARRREAVADLHALDRVDAHQRGGEIAVELGIDRRAETGRHAFRHDLDHRADGRALLADAFEIFRPRIDGARRRDRRTDCAPPSAQSQFARSMVLVPICTSAPRTVTFL